MLRLFFVIFLIFFFECSGSDVQLFEKTRIVMDTLVSITIYAKQEPEDWQQHVEQAFETMQRIEDLATSFNDSSEVGQLNLNAGHRGISVHKDVLEIIKQAQEVGENSDGAFDVTVLPLLRLWNFKSSNPRVPTQDEVLEKRGLVDFRRIVINDNNVFLPEVNMGMDLGAIAKGYAVDKAVEVLEKYDYKNFMVEAGGDLRAIAGELTRGQRTIWVRHPRKVSGFFAKIKMDEGAVASSGDYERFFEVSGKRFHHIVNPKTGYPASPVVSVTIFSETTVLADAYATAVFVLGPEKGLDFIEKLPETEGLIVYQKEIDSDLILDWKVSKGIARDLEIFNQKGNL